MIWYEEAHLLVCFSDLALGDCHLIPIDDVTSRKEGNDWVSS